MDALTVEQIAARTGWSLRRVQRAVAKWHARGWPAVRYERVAALRRSPPRTVARVDAEEFEALLRGELPDRARAAAA